MNRKQQPGKFLRAFVCSLSFTVTLFAASSLRAQNDSLILNNGDEIVGEIKSMNKGVVTIETDYSDSDFKIEWEKIVKLTSNQTYTLALVDKTVLTNAKVASTGDGKLTVSDEYTTREVDINDIVYFRQLDDTFLSKLSASVDVGYSLTKASNLQQYNASVSLGYQSDQWTYGASYRQVRSSQDDVEPIRRVDGDVSADYMMRNGIFYGASVNFLSNTEQNLVLRTTGVLGGGYYFVRTNTWFWNGFIGAAINNEDFEEGLDSTGESSDRESLEGVLGTELNVYDVGDIDIVTSVYWFPSFTEAGRHRMDYRLDVSYEVFDDFFIKAGLTLNYDNQPAPGASQTDYVVLTGFGWEW